MNDSSGKRLFNEDIFADDNEKWSWPLGRTSNITSSEVSNYSIHPGNDKCSSSSSNSDALFKTDSTDSLKKNFRKREYSSGSDGNLPEDGSSSPGTISRSIPHERVIPSIYDDDAQSGNPSGVFEKTDLAFQSSFIKEFDALHKKNSSSNPLESNSSNKSQSGDKEFSVVIDDKSRSPSVRISPKGDSGERSSGRSESRISEGRERKYRGRSRSRSKERREKSPKSSSHRSGSRERRRYSKSRRSRSPRSRRSRSRDRRRSHSRDRDSRRRSRSKDYDSRRRSKSKEFRKRSRSRSYDRRRRSHRSSSRDRYRRRRHSRSRSRSRDRSRGSANRKPGSLPLSSSGGAMTPQMALQQTMAAMSAKAQAMTGIALPKYYNPAAVNPLKYAEQVQKRKLLWQNKEKEDEQPKNTVWDKLTFDQDQDGKMTAKFRKLMGIKSDGTTEQESETKESVLQKQAVLFRDLDQQYEMARVTTHTQRGVGLGYSATTLYPPVQK